MLALQAALKANIVGNSGWDFRHAMQAFQPGITAWQAFIAGRRCMLGRHALHAVIAGMA